MHTMTEIIEAAEANKREEIAAIDAEIERQENFAKMTAEWCAYTLERLRYRRSLLVDQPPKESTMEDHAARFTGVEVKKAA